ncbi:MAG: DUF4231 domain-containing protein [Leptolyngbyaceae bacterium]|nr:DUF4231 domain-containing protein [Leptolyngbyaceae bacterium]
MTSEFNPSTYCNPALEDAWRRFGDFDKNASLAQKRFLKQRKWITMLGVIVTTLAVLDLLLENSLTEGHWFAQWLQSLFPGQFQFIQAWVGNILNLIIIIIPILISILVAGAVKFNMGISWVMLRSAAESIKHEIFRYRTQVGIYSPDHVPPSGKPETRDVTLARRIKQIGKRVMETQVNMSELEIYDYKKEGLPPVYGVAPGDDGFSDLTPEQYMHWRIEDQFDYYRSKAKRLARELQRFQWSIYIIGGLGTLLAAVQMEIWVAVTSAVVAALGSFLEFKRVETNLIGMNLAASDLYDIRAWWRALSDSAKQQASNKATLVKSAEGIIQGENASWLTEMRDALSEVYGDEDSEDDNDNIAVLPETVVENSASTATATSALDLKGEGGSWLSMMQSTLAEKDVSAPSSSEQSDSVGDAYTDSSVESEIRAEEDVTAYGDIPDDGAVYDDSPYEEAIASDSSYTFESDSDYEFEGVVSEDTSYDEAFTGDDDSLDEEPLFGDEAIMDEPMMEGDRPTSESHEEPIGLEDTLPVDASDDWLDTPTTLDDSIDSILNEDTSDDSDDEDISPFSIESENGFVTSDGGTTLSDGQENGASVNGASVFDAALQMDLPDGYEEDLKVFSDPLAEEFAPAPFERVAGDKPEDDDDEDEDFQSNLSDLGEFVMTPFQRASGDKPEDEDDEDDDLQSNLSDLGEFVMSPFQREPGDVPEAERENSEGQTV